MSSVPSVPALLPPSGLLYVAVVLHLALFFLFLQQNAPECPGVAAVRGGHVKPEPGFSVGEHPASF